MPEILKTENGIRVVLEYMPYIKSVSAGVWIKSGSCFETDEFHGISHFIEHMLFKGTDSRSAKDIAAAMDAVGGQLNAFTARDCTCFYTKTLSEHIETAFELLADMLLNSKFDKTDTAMEKSVIKEEIDMYEDTPDELVHDMLSELCYKNHPIGKNILGTKQSVDLFDKYAAKRYMNMRYCADTVVISAAGNFDRENIMQNINKYFASGLPMRSVNKVAEKPVFSGGYAEKEKQVEQVSMAIGLPSVDFRHSDMYSAMLVSNILGGNMSSRLFQHIREERGLAYSIYTCPNMFEETGYTSIYAGCAPENAGKVTELIKKELDDIKTNGIGSEEIEFAKTQMKCSYYMACESASSKMSSYGKQLLLQGKIICDDEVIKKINEINAESVDRIKHLFDFDKAAAAVVKPCR